jgi:hypothetical protein
MSSGMLKGMQNPVAGSRKGVTNIQWVLVRHKTIKTSSVCVQQEGSKLDGFEYQQTA